MNTALMLTCLVLVFGFRSSAALAAACGVAVTGTMVITTTLFFVIARYRWKWPLPLAGSVAGFFMTVDLGFFAANVVKIPEGGWVPLVLAAGIFTLMSTWKRGSDLVVAHLAQQAVPLDVFLDEVARTHPPRVPGTAVFLTPDIHGTPSVLLHHFRHNKLLHAHVVLLSIVYEDIPDVPDDEQVRTERLPEGFVRVRAYYGFMEPPSVEQVVDACTAAGLLPVTDDVTFYLGRARILPTGPAPMMRWRKRLYGFMERADFPRAEYLEVGWGDREYWQAHEPGIGLGLKALLLPTPSVVRVVGVSGALAAVFPESEIIEVRLSRAGFERLGRFVHDSFARDGDTRTPPLTPAWPGVLFYPARGAYHALRTSNTWTAAALRAAGFPITPAYALTAGHVIRQTRGHGRVIHRPARHAAGILVER